MTEEEFRKLFQLDVILMLVHAKRRQIRSTFLRKTWNSTLFLFRVSFSSFPDEEQDSTRKYSTGLVVSAKNGYHKFIFNLHKQIFCNGIWRHRFLDQNCFQTIFQISVLLLLPLPVPLTLVTHLFRFCFKRWINFSLKWKQQILFSWNLLVYAISPNLFFLATNKIPSIFILYLSVNRLFYPLFFFDLRQISPLSSSSVSNPKISLYNFCTFFFYL